MRSASSRSALRRIPVERYPVQHATTQFHLGLALAQEGELSVTEAALAKAAALFPPSQPCRLMTRPPRAAGHARHGDRQLAGLEKVRADVDVVGDRVDGPPMSSA